MKLDSSSEIRNVEDYNLSWPIVIYRRSLRRRADRRFVGKSVIGYAIKSQYTRYDETSLFLSFSLILLSVCSIFLSLSSRLRSTDRHKSAAIGGSGSLAFRCLLRRTDRAGRRLRPDRGEHRAAGTPISGSEEPDEMPHLKIRRWDPNSMQLARSVSRECAATHCDAWRWSTSQCHNSAPRRGINSRYRRLLKRRPREEEKKLRESLSSSLALSEIAFSVTSHDSQRASSKLAWYLMHRLCRRRRKDIISRYFFSLVPSLFVFLFLLRFSSEVKAHNSRSSPWERASAMAPLVESSAWLYIFANSAVTLSHRFARGT